MGTEELKELYYPLVQSYNLLVGGATQSRWGLPTAYICSPNLRKFSVFRQYMVVLQVRKFFGISPVFICFRLLYQNTILGGLLTTEMYFS